MQSPDELREKLREQNQDEETALSPATQLSIDVEGARGKRYEGTFTYHVPTIGDQVEIGKLKTAYLPSGGAADPNALLLVEQMCYLAVTIRDPKPDWWDPWNMYDAAPLTALYTEALTYERRFHGGDTERADAGNAAQSDDADESLGSDTAREAPLGRKVQPPAQRRETIVAHSS